MTLVTGKSSFGNLARPSVTTVGIKHKLARKPREKTCIIRTQRNDTLIDHKLIVVSKTMRKLLEKQKDYDGNSFKTVKVKEFLASIDDNCHASLYILIK